MANLISLRNSNMTEYEVNVLRRVVADEVARYQLNNSTLLTTLAEYKALARVLGVLEGLTSD